MRRVAVFGAVAWTGLVAVFAGPAGAQAVYRSFEAEIEVRADGTVEIVETVEVEFTVPRHGIFRDMPEKYVYDDQHLRDTDIEVRSVTRDGSPEPYEVFHEGEQDELFRLRVGHPDVEIEGVHRYVVTYSVEGALNTFPGSHEELYWNVVGSYWEAAFGTATVTVRGPEAVRWACFSGPAYATEPCTEEQAGRDGVRYSATGVGSGSDMTVVVGFRAGSVTVGAPQLEEIWSDGKAFEPTPVNAGLAVLVGAASVAFLVWRLRKGRDEREAGGLHEPGSADPGDAPVVFRPPAGLTPAHVGLIDDERVDPVDVGATVLDLAVRGHVLVEDRREAGDDDPDWVLVLRVGANPDDELAPFEQRLVEGLEEEAENGEVSLEDVKGEFHAHFKAVANILYDDAVSRGWFRRRPDRVRALYLILAVVALAAAVGVVSAALAMRWKLGLTAAPLALLGLALLLTHRRMPAKTARGRSTLVYTRGFKKFIETAEKPEMNYAVEQGEFLRYLPYAVAFGAVEAWSRATRGIDVAAATAGWYHGPVYSDWGSFGSGFSSFASSVGSGLSSAPAGSGGSGFSGGGSGGGMGGGGGGSW